MSALKQSMKVKKYVSCEGVTVFLLPVLSFHKHVTNCYLVLEDQLTLIDVGSGYGTANETLVESFSQLNDEFGVKLQLADVQRVIISHGHIDHFGALDFVLEKTNAKLYIHQLDEGAVANYQERRVISITHLHNFLDRSGLTPDEIDDALSLHALLKDVFHSVPVESTFTEGQLPGSELEAIHTPGHCPGQVCLRLHDLLFTGDHILSHITPHQSPESITRNTGVGHYLASLKKVRRVEGIKTGLGGHGKEIGNIYNRIDETIAFHEERLEKTLDICSEPKSTSQISQELFGERKSYEVYLAVLEAGAHIEYLYDRGQLEAVNFEDIEEKTNPVFLYKRR